MWITRPYASSTLSCIIARDEWRLFTNAANVRDYFGTGPHIAQGSPARHAAQLRAPVLLFHGDLDRNVGIR